MLEGARVCGCDVTEKDQETLSWQTPVSTACSVQYDLFEPDTARMLLTRRYSSASVISRTLRDRGERNMSPVLA